LKTHWINNTNVESSSDSSIKVQNPATEEVIDLIPRGTEEDVEQGVKAAKDASKGWATLAPKARKEIIKKVSRRIEENKDKIAEILTSEQGKPLPQAKAEVNGIIGMIDEYAEMAVSYRTGVQGSAEGELTFQKWQARGVTACIVPWNFPLQVAFETIVPNLAVGNTVVVKPASLTPLSLRYIADIAFDELPSGVCNVLLGSGSVVGEHLINHKDVDTIMFIGSEKTGLHIGEAAGKSLKKVILELGGKDALVIDDTVDVKEAAKQAADACFANSGQICTSTERIYVQEGIYEEFISHLKEEAANVKWGNGNNSDVTMGPIVDENQRNLIHQHVENAIAAGAEVHFGGANESIDGKGYFYTPTVITNVNEEMEIICDETFGPVAPVMTYKNFSDAIDNVNKSNYGLSAIVYTESSKNAIEAIERLEAGMIKINTKRGKSPGATSEPFKLSGIGKGYGIEVMQELTIQKSIHWKSTL